MAAKRNARRVVHKFTDTQSFWFVYMEVDKVEWFTA